MNYNRLLDLAVDLGYSLSVCGAETFRVEDSIRRLLASYGLTGEVFAIPNYLIVSITTEEGKPITKMRRIGTHGNNLDSVERLNNLNRRLCAERPEPEKAAEMLEDTVSSAPVYSFPFYLLGNFLGAAGFALVFGCGFPDMLISGLCGAAVGITNRFTESRNINFFFSTAAASFVLAVIAYLFNLAGIAQNTDSIVIGALMILVPGLLFTNAMRDIIYGDTNSGINRIVQVVMIAVAIALGTAAAWWLVCALLREPVSSAAGVYTTAVSVLGALIGCDGFCFLFNIHGRGTSLCALGGVLVWCLYLLVLKWTGSNMLGYFCGSVFAAAYAEIMARIRKYPAICYLVVSLFPLLPGAGVYYTMNYALHGNMQAFASEGMETAAIAGCMAVGIMLVSAIVQLIYTEKDRHSHHFL